MQQRKKPKTKHQPKTVIQKHMKSSSFSPLHRFSFYLAFSLSSTKQKMMISEQWYETFS